VCRSVHVLVDASWEVGHSVSGVVLVVAGGAANWVSRKQDFKAEGACEGEGKIC
jgi:hypothetical protein